MSSRRAGMSFHEIYFDLENADLNISGEGPLYFKEGAAWGYANEKKAEITEVMGFMIAETDTRKEVLNVSLTGVIKIGPQFEGLKEYIEGRLIEAHCEI